MKSGLFFRIFKSNRSKIHSKLVNLHHFLGFTPGSMHLYEQAFRHNSYNSGKDDLSGKISNERLEFLGDSVLNTIVAELLFLRYPTKGEGFLTEMRSKIVSREKLCEVAIKMGIDDFMLVGRSLHNNKSVIRTLSGNTIEALLGAIYLDKGYKFTRKFIYNKILKFYVDLNELAEKEVNFKSKLIEWAQKSRKEASFELVEEKITGKLKTYVIKAVVNGEEMGRGEDFSKKKAEQLAAQRACNQIFGS